MNLTHLKVADLDQQAVDRIRSLERDIDAHIMALEPQVNLRKLDEDDMKKLRELEEALGVVLIAYDPI